jgi:transcriptional/translational regulatory protein YebC/TACO1
LPCKIFCEPQDLKKIEDLIVSWKTGLTTAIQAVESTGYVAVDPTEAEDDVKEKVEKLKHDLQAYDDSLKVWTTLDTL